MAALVLLAILLACRTTGYHANPSLLTEASAPCSANKVTRDWMTDFSPFSPRTVLEYCVIDTSRVVFTLRSFEGSADTLLDSLHTPGQYRYAWKPDSAWVPGVYVLTFHIGNYQDRDVIDATWLFGYREERK